MEEPTEWDLFQQQFLSVYEQLFRCCTFINLEIRCNWTDLSLDQFKQLHSLTEAIETVKKTKDSSGYDYVEAVAIFKTPDGMRVIIDDMFNEKNSGKGSHEYHISVCTSGMKCFQALVSKHVC